jgi:hypothetical protein
MCFMLYAGTTKALPLKGWNKDTPGLSVRALKENEADIRVHFSLPEVQNIGSTSNCGCDFPHVTLTRGEWIGYPEVEVDDPEWEASERFNREALVALLQGCGEETVELYGVWLYDSIDLSKPENVRQDIALANILEPTFRFKERGLYRVGV